MTRGEAQAQIIEILLDRIRRDRYPSATQMAMVEDALPRDMVPEYLAILMEKVAQDSVPSIPMLRRMQRVAESLPVDEAPPDDEAWPDDEEE